MNHGTPHARPPCMALVRFPSAHTGNLICVQYSLCYGFIAWTEFLDLMSSIDFPLRRCDECKSCPRCGTGKSVALHEDEEARAGQTAPLSVSAEQEVPPR